MHNSPSRSFSLICFGLCLVGFCWLGGSWGPDGSWDLRNYHIYNPFALLNGKFGYDIVPAQMQTFNGPQLDLLYYAVRHYLNNRPVLADCILSIPHAVAAFLGWRIAWFFIPPTVPLGFVLGLLAAGIGATGASALPTLAGTYSDIVPACLCLAGLLLLLSNIEIPQAYWRFGLAGALFGLAGGLKLTAAPYCAASILAVLCGAGLPLYGRVRATIALGVGQAVALASCSGPWWLTLYLKYGSPMFPYFNSIFRSPFYSPIDLGDQRFKPIDLLHALFYPFYWAVNTRPLVSELSMSDPRFAVAFVSVVALLVRAGVERRWPDAQTTVLLVFFFVSYVLWELLFCIFRYLAALEFLTPVIVLAALQAWRHEAASLWRQWAGTVLFALLAYALTVYPDWGHVSPGQPIAKVVFPALPHGALVVLLDGSPMAYVAAFAPADIRFVGVNNNLIWPGQGSLLQQQAEATIRTSVAPVWGLENPPEDPGTADSALKYYGLRRAVGCVTISSNLDNNELRLCPLQREK